MVKTVAHRLPLVLIPAILAYEALVILVNLTIYGTISAAFGIGGPWLIALFVLLAFTFMAATILSHVRKGPLVDWYYRFSAYWFGLAMFLFGGALSFYIVLNIFYSRGMYVSPAPVGAICFGAFFLIHLYGTWNSRDTRVKKIQVKFSGLPGFDAAFWKGKKIVFVSDLQLGNVYRSGFASRIVRTINASHPYAVLIGGDLYDGVATDEEKIIEPLRGLQAPGGIFFITGNHEYYLPDVPGAIDAVKALGIRILDNEKAELGGIQLAGVDDRTSHKPEDFKAIMRSMDLDHSKPSILLKHQPSDLPIAEEAGVSLVLSGHTHHGQIFPLNFFTWQMYKGFDYGLKRLKNMWVYTSSGAGTWGAPLRLGTHSEVVEIELV